MSIDYILADPTGNITVLIRSSYNDLEERSRMIRDAFALEPSCEQAGFIMSERSGHISLEMMGYEFCGNATLSSASWQAYSDGLKAGEHAVVTVTSAGTELPLTVNVTRLPDINEDKTEGSLPLPVFKGSLSMPEPSMSSFHGYPLVNMNGISHLIVPEDECSPSQAESLIRGFADGLGVPALGIMLFSELSEHSVSMKPLVYVPESETLVWEHGCATGSTAAGYCFFRNGTARDHIDVKQPGGIISISDQGSNLLLTGQVILHIQH